MSDVKIYKPRFPARFSVTSPPKKDSSGSAPAVARNLTEAQNNEPLSPVSQGHVAGVPGNVSEKPFAEFFKDNIDIEVYGKIGDSVYLDEDKNRSINRVLLENGNAYHHASAAGSAEIDEYRSRWVKMAGRFSSKEIHGEIRHTFNARKIEASWPQNPECVKLALKDIFNPILNIVVGMSSKRKDVLEVILGLADTNPNVFNEMIDNPIEFFKTVPLREHIRVKLLSVWMDVSGPDRLSRAMAHVNIPPEVIDSVRLKWRGKMHLAVEKNPYAILACGATVEQAHALAEYMDVPVRFDDKVSAYIHGVLLQAEKAGSTMISKSDVISRIIGGDKDKILTQEELDRMKTLKESELPVDSQIMVVAIGGESYFALRENMIDEIFGSTWVIDRINRSRAEKVKDLEGYADNLALSRKYAEEALTTILPGKPIDKDQLEAIAVAALEPVCILTGGPGTGKTTVSQALIYVLEKLYKAPDLIKVGAPTGKAAQCSTKSTGKQADTLHSILKAIPKNDGTLTFDQRVKFKSGTIFIIDEASMVDTKLMSALARAMPSDGRLILVGDDAQLEPVGAGQVMADMVRAGNGGINRVPIVRLTKLYRSDASGGIAIASEKMRKGEVPDLNEVDGFTNIVDGNYGFDACGDDMVTAQVIEHVKHLRDTGVSCEDFAVLSPMRKGPGGTHEINAALSKLLNPDGKPFSDLKENDKIGVPPRIGDRILITKNYKLTDGSGDRVVNGDVGLVLSATANNVTLQIDGKEKKTVLPRSRWRNIILSYAITVHKSQGSQYKDIIIPLSMKHKTMLERRLIRTALTRAKSRALFVGDPEAYDLAINTDRSKVRQTLMVKMLSESLSKDPTMTPIASGPVLKPGDVDYFEMSEWLIDAIEEDAIDFDESEPLPAPKINQKPVKEAIFSSEFPVHSEQRVQPATTHVNWSGSYS